MFEETACTHFFIVVFTFIIQEDRGILNQNSWGETGRYRDGDGRKRGVVSLRGRAEGIGGVGNPEERTFLREPLALQHSLR